MICNYSNFSHSIGCLFICCVWFFATLWTVARQTPLSMVFSRQEYCSGLPFPTPGGLPDPDINPPSPPLAGSFFFNCWATQEAHLYLKAVTKFSLGKRLGNNQFSSAIQLYPTLCDPMDCSLPISSVDGILQARILQWVAMLSSRESKDQTWVSKSPALAWALYQ